MKHLDKIKHSIANQINLAVGVVLIIVFFIMITIVSLVISKELGATISAELQELSNVHSAEIQSRLDGVHTMSEGIQDYMLRKYEKASEEFSTETVNEVDVISSASVTTKAIDEVDAVSSASIYRSPLFDVQYARYSYDLEKYLMETFRTNVLHNPIVNSSGIFFEPYSFDKNIRDFNMISWKDENDGMAKTYGTYEEFSQKYFYAFVKNKQANSITDPYMLNGKPIVSIMYPIVWRDKFYGTVLTDIDISHFNKIIDTSERYPSMIAGILTDKALVAYSTNEQYGVGDDYSGSLSEEAKNNMERKIAFKDTYNGRTSFFAPLQVPGTTWWSITSVENQDMNKELIKTIALAVVLSIGGMVVLLVISNNVIHRKLKPIQDIVKVSNQIAEGNLNVEITYDHTDEIGNLADSMRKTAETLKLYIGDISQNLKHIADGDMTHEIYIQYIGDFIPIKESMTQISSKLSETMAYITQASKEVNTSAEEMAKGVSELEHGVTEQASVVEEFIASVEDLTNYIAKNMKEIKWTNEISNLAKRQAFEGTNTMEKMLISMDTIDKSSNDISNIVQIIADIADQTNLLALNASIEAARAGETGRGFAVVATEIRELANKSSETVIEISKIIEESLSNIKAGRDMAYSTASALEDIVASVQKTASIAESILKDSENQLVTVEDLTQGINQISTVVETNAATSQESAIISKELAAQAEKLELLMRQFKVK
jgi:methyl-accepting chemotaxis protein|nr:methyl-accepting chemotaxis protein [uncultured Lachnoclostridium sp.]